jgi:DNA-binding NarL/FixJ family response regulator
MKEIRIVLADAQYLARAGYHHLLQQHAQLRVVGEAEDFEELESTVRELSPDIVIFDYHNSDTFEIEDICRVSDQFPEVRFLVVTGEEDKANIFKVLECGVNSIVTKHCSQEEIIAAIKSTSRSEKFFCNKVLNVILEKHLGGNDEDDCYPSNLTAREIEIVELVASGISTREIAEKLHLSPHTIYTHRKNVMKKLGINSVSEMILYAINSGIVKPAVNQL